MNTILGTKKEMSQSFVEGVRTPVTVIKAGPCVVTMVKTKDRDGYWGVQLGFGEKKLKSISKAVKGHLKKVGAYEKKAPRFLREVRLDSEPEVKVGDEILVASLFKKGDVVRVTGVSKGKGFAGGMKRWGFAGGPRTHGQSDRERAPGSIGQGTTPGRVWKGKKMAGRMGSENITVANLIVVGVNEEAGELEIGGPVPGRRGGLLVVQNTKRSAVAESTENSEVAEKVEKVEKEDKE